MGYYCIYNFNVVLKALIFFMRTRNVTPRIPGVTTLQRRGGGRGSRKQGGLNPRFPNLALVPFRIGSRFFDLLYRKILRNVTVPTTISIFLSTLCSRWSPTPYPSFHFSTLMTLLQLDRIRLFFFYSLTLILLC